MNKMKVCVTCQGDVEGKKAFPIQEDRIIGAIRAMKRILRVAQNNELYVCESCLPKHIERRRSFEKTLLFASVLAGLMLILVTISPLLSGRFEAMAIFSGIVVAGLIISMPILFKYVPAVQGVSASARKAAPPPMPQPAPAPPLPVPPLVGAPPKAKEPAPRAKKRSGAKKGSRAKK